MDEMEELTRRLLSTTDAMEWARAFVAIAADNPYKCLDAGLMVSWFASAIETGRTAGAQSPVALGHDYLSTACLHELHDRCRQTCKFCHVGCRCSCHSEEPGRDG